MTAVLLNADTGELMMLTLRDMDSGDQFRTQWQCVRHVRYLRPRFQRMLDYEFPPPKFVVTVEGRCSDER